MIHLMQVYENPNAGPGGGNGGNGGHVIFQVCLTTYFFYCYVCIHYKKSNYVLADIYRLCLLTSYLYSSMNL